ncbi:putative L-ascorbate peroxidase 6, chloroplastic [Hordeum vulgare]|nr:putative L-ascorbate peroxidase 6, chloroplastic [Hordeum vulgare]
MTEGRLQPAGDNFQVHLGWHDAGTYAKNISEWPRCGGANGSLRFEIELKHAANAGLVNALKLIEAIKDKYTSVTYADLFQLASAIAVEEAGGPKIPMIYGRVDVSALEQCPPEGDSLFNGDDQILRFYAALQRWFLKFLDFTTVLAVLCTSSFSLFVACVLLHKTEVLNSGSL